MATAFQNLHEATRTVGVRRARTRAGFAWQIATMLIATLLAVAPLVPAAGASGIEGRWTTFDDDTKQPRSVVEIASGATGFTGRIVALTPEPGQPPEPVCTACTGARAGAPILGMTILHVTRSAAAEEYTGTVFDPEEGVEYRCTVTVDPDGSRLRLRGYVGVPLFGRTATWSRAP